MLLICNTSQVIVWNAGIEHTSRCPQLYDLRLPLVCCQESWGPSAVFLLPPFPSLHRSNRESALPRPPCCAAAGRRSHLAVAGNPPPPQQLFPLMRCLGARCLIGYTQCGVTFTTTRPRGRQSRRVAGRRVKRAWAAGAGFSDLLRCSFPISPTLWSTQPESAQRP